MTVRLLRAFDGHAAGEAYTGTPEVEADLLRNGNADTNLVSCDSPVDSAKEQTVEDLRVLADATGVQYEASWTAAELRAAIEAKAVEPTVGKHAKRGR
jgi:hypothetical protein